MVTKIITARHQTGEEERSLNAAFVCKACLRLADLSCSAMRAEAACKLTS